MTELDRVFNELAALREQISDTQSCAARVEERIALFTAAAAERASKHSGNVAKLDSRLSKLETWRWLLVGAWLAVPVAWAVFQEVKGR